MNYLVTGGGTEERIDGVRSITNFATGRLGALIAEGLSRQCGTGTVFYVHGKHAARPEDVSREHGGAAIRLIEVEGVSDLEAAVRRVLAGHEIGAIVHSMAVSDYTVDRVLDGEGREITARDKIASSERELRLILKRGVFFGGDTGKVVRQHTGAAVFFEQCERLIRERRFGNVVQQFEADQRRCGRQLVKEADYFRRASGGQIIFGTRTGKNI